MRVSIKQPGGRLNLNVLPHVTPWRVSCPGRPGEALLDPSAPAFLAEGYPEWLRALCAPIDADRQLALAIVAEVRRITG